MGEDFNVIVNDKEKMGALSLNSKKLWILQYALIVVLMEVRYTSSNFTWWNRKDEEALYL